MSHSASTAQRTDGGIFATYPQNEVGFSFLKFQNRLLLISNEANKGRDRPIPGRSGKTMRNEARSRWDRPIGCRTIGYFTTRGVRGCGGG